MKQNMDKKTIPQSVDECLIRSKSVNGLINWADKLEKIGKTLLAVTIISGVITTIVNLANMDPDNPATVTSTVVSLVFTVLGALMIYVINNFLVLVLRGLSETAYNTSVSANLALMEAAGNGTAAPRQQTSAEPVSVPAPAPAPAAAPIPAAPAAPAAPAVPAAVAAPSVPAPARTAVPAAESVIEDNVAAEEPSAPAETPLPEGAVRVSLDYGNIVCPICRTRQPGDRRICDGCGAAFVVEE